MDVEPDLDAHRIRERVIGHAESIRKLASLPMPVSFLLQEVAGLVKTLADLAAIERGDR